MSARLNDISIHTKLGATTVSHFKLYEFENDDHLVAVHPSVPRCLERVRRDLTNHYGEDVRIIITNAVRTQADLEKLAEHYGWIDEGGTVSRNSQHLLANGACAVDIKALAHNSNTRVPQTLLGGICRRYFDFVKDDYGDGHVHADNRANCKYEQRFGEDHA